jgi:hypothetical protein
MTDPEYRVTGFLFDSGRVIGRFYEAVPTRGSKPCGRRGHDRENTPIHTMTTYQLEGARNATQKFSS